MKWLNFHVLKLKSGEVYQFTVTGLEFCINIFITIKNGYHEFSHNFKFWLQKTASKLRKVKKGYARKWWDFHDVNPADDSLNFLSHDYKCNFTITFRPIIIFDRLIWQGKKIKRRVNAPLKFAWRNQYEERRLDLPDVVVVMPCLEMDG